MAWPGDVRWPRRPEQLLRLARDQAALILAVAIGAGLVIPSIPCVSLCYYFLVLPACAANLWRNRVWQKTHAEALLATALIIWFTAGIIIDRGAGANPGSDVLWLWNGLCTLVFVRAGLHFFGAPGADRERLVSILIWCGIVNSAWSIARFHLSGGMPDRMEGWGITRLPILGASVIGVCVLLALSRLLSGRQRSLCFLSIALGLLFIWFTGSRGPLIAVTVSLFFMIAVWRRPWAVAIAAAILVAFGILAGVCESCATDIWSHFFNRGWSNRLEIWQMTLDQVSQRPFFGYGPAARLPRPTDNFPHNLFLSTLFYSGLIGLVLLVSLLGHGLWRNWSAPDRLARAAGLYLLLSIVQAGMTDLSAITKGPSPIWYIVWLPWILSGPLHRPAVTAAACPGSSARAGPAPP